MIQPPPKDDLFFTNEQLDKELQYWPGVVFFIVIVIVLFFILWCYIFK